MPRYHLTWRKLAEIDSRKATFQISKEIAAIVAILSGVLMIGFAR